MTLAGVADMLRHFHAVPGLLAALLFLVLAPTGAFLAFDSIAERARTAVPALGEVSLADIAAAVQARHPELESIRRSPSGALVVRYTDQEGQGAERVDARTGEAIGPYAPSPLTRTMTALHRAFLSGDFGRAVAGMGALAMLILCLTGAALLARRLGGWSALLRPSRGTLSQRLHCEVGRFALGGLLLSALTGCWMSLVTFGLLPDGEVAELPPIEREQGMARTLMPVGHMAALRGIDIGSLRELTFPDPADPAEGYTLVTTTGTGRVNAATGELVGFAPHGLSQRIHDTVTMLHTGRGAWLLAVLLGLSSLAAPVLAVAGGAIWWQRQATRPRIPRNVATQSADTIILVGSEGNTTWAFAATLHAALTAAGHRVHAAPMNDLAPRYAKAKRLLLLAATYGDGAAPASARDFLGRLDHCHARLPVAVLGFGDRGFPRFCGYADQVAATLRARHWPALLGTTMIDRQSAQEFARWGKALGAATGTTLDLVHVAQRPRTVTLELTGRVDHGVASEAPTAILRFTAPRRPRFEAGDLLGVLPPGSEMPRFYSLASASADGVVEICVRKRPGGLCSGFLHGLQPGARIEAFIRPNPAFRPAPGGAPVILVGAGAGIAPLAGIARHNSPARPMHLYWGARSPEAGLPFEQDLVACVGDRRLARLATVFSRVPGGGYVQDRLAADAALLRDLVQRGAQVMVCGGRDMGSGVARAFETILEPLGLDLGTLRAEGRYVEDVY